MRPKKIERWEYLYVVTAGEERSLQTYLGERGNEGWELVSVQPKAPLVALYFKRRR